MVLHNFLCPEGTQHIEEGRNKQVKGKKSEETKNRKKKEDKEVKENRRKEKERTKN